MSKDPNPYIYNLDSEGYLAILRMQAEADAQLTEQAIQRAEQYQADRRMYRNLPRCPYCGERVQPRMQGQMWAMDCSSCGAQGPYAYTKSDAVITYYEWHPAHAEAEHARIMRRSYQRAVIRIPDPTRRKEI